ncbi:hypothetical protein [Pseudonocardia sp. Ae717_Ps2]|uniref:hypothetical protein n=1 Tax=Pseudonocardia sp. Ae717_Ps2 TaxID=1885573 RepID=UPI00094AD103|nr:hypothetical protein [Pseudonocardia sp. Ae717_Ps2]
MTVALTADPGSSALDGCIIGLKLTGAVLMLVGAPTAPFSARAVVPGLPCYVPWVGLCLAVAWSADAVVTALGAGSQWWDLMVTLVYVIGTVPLVLVVVREIRRRTPDSGS